MNAPMRRLEKASFEAEISSVKRMWEIREGQNPIERIAKVAVGACLKSRVVRSLVSPPTHIQSPEGYSFIGKGWEQAVYRKDDQVLKVLHDTANKYADLTPHNLAEKLQTETDICKEQLGPRWVPTEFDIMPMGDLGQDTVVARQPFIEARASFVTTHALARDTKVATAEKNDFADSLTQLHSNTGLHADIIGCNNIYLVEGSGLTMVDTIPVDAAQQAVAMPDGRPIGEHITEGLTRLRVG